MLLEKLLVRFREGSSAEWTTIAGVLPHLKFTEKMIIKTIELYECWKERMLDMNGQVMDSFAQVLANIKKSWTG